MKQHFLLLLVLAFLSCEKKRSINISSENLKKEFHVKIDTFKISPKGDLREVALFRNNFYTIFESQRKNTSQSFIKMMAFNQKGKFIEDVFVPSEIQDMPHYQINIENDSLYVKESQFEENNFVLGEYVADLLKVKKKNFRIYQDSIYNIYKDCNGEFGGTIYFETRKSSKVYETYSSCPTVVNKIGETYFITNAEDFGNILEISNPSELDPSKLDFERRQGSKFSNGYKILLETNYETRIFTSFVSNNKLLTIYCDKKSTYIGEIVNGKLKPLYDFGFRFYANFQQQIQNKQILSCYLIKSKSYAIMIIKENEIKFHVIK
ncbi:hypothetical protein FNO01nite_34260 [Flavobacterium noncentrifugens]|uniref:TolB-like 6-blade propeller-like n=1 Tax=Flavobacterium noncentrifugens TaxID=1128970 RepID=A0A1G8XRT5_9FLAO|nr:hypothetical protein [Flavobacterium noncentrifugens]GEP52754.1 hypothetical protein FNO01nite_34260 [Flavobacterium noncentrifugens]SDJ93203.1 hypothetical protein SAMN04487935_2035 [Flavobacterium noncentrifugens]